MQEMKDAIKTINKGKAEDIFGLNGTFHFCWRNVSKFSPQTDQYNFQV
jgi:hypothetical protein